MTDHNNVGTGSNVSGSGVSSGGASVSISVGTTVVTGGTSGRILYDNAGVVGELATSGTGSVLRADGFDAVYPSGLILARDPNNHSRQYYATAYDFGNQYKVPLNGALTFGANNDDCAGTFASLVADADGLRAAAALGGGADIGFRSLTHRLTPATAPSAPSTGWTLYVDSGDGNKLKAIAANGTIVTLGTP